MMDIFWRGMIKNKVGDIIEQSYYACTIIPPDIDLF